MPLPLLLPKLVQETIYFYEWRIRIKRLHRKYKKKVILDDDAVWWKIYGVGLEEITLLYTVDWNCYRDRLRVWRFIDGRRHTYKLPSSYHYSSGMRNPQGYNNN